MVYGVQVSTSVTYPVRHHILCSGELRPLHPDALTDPKLTYDTRTESQILVTVDEDSITAFVACDVHENGFLCMVSDHKYSIFVPAVVSILRELLNRLSG